MVLAAADTPKRKRVNMALAITSLTLRRTEAKQLIRLLGELQSALESSIEGLVPPAGGPPKDKRNRLQLAKDRRDWNQAEKWVKRLSDVID